MIISFLGPIYIAGISLNWWPHHTHSRHQEYIGLARMDVTKEQKSVYCIVEGLLSLLLKVICLHTSKCWVNINGMFYSYLDFSCILSCIQLVNFMVISMHKFLNTSVVSRIDMWRINTLKI